MSAAEAWLALALAGALGAVARDLIDGVLTRRLPETRLPVGILVVNLLGCLALGLLLGGGAAAEFALIVGVGFLGAFTTFSTFAVQAVRLGTRDGALYVTATVLGGVALTGLGLAL